MTISAAVASQPSSWSPCILLLPRPPPHSSARRQQACRWRQSPVASRAMAWQPLADRWHREPERHVHGLVRHRQRPHGPAASSGRPADHRARRTGTGQPLDAGRCRRRGSKSHILLAASASCKHCCGLCRPTTTPWSPKNAADVTVARVHVRVGRAAGRNEGNGVATRHTR